MSGVKNTRRYIQREALTNGITNTLANGLIAWWLLKGSPPLTWGGAHSFSVDVVATAFLLPLIVALIVIPLQRRKLRLGKQSLRPLNQNRWLERQLSRFPQTLWASALRFGLVGTLLFSPLTLAAFFALGIEHVAPAHYALFKGLWAGLLAAVMVVPMVMLGLSEPQPPKQPSELQPQKSPSSL